MTKAERKQRKARKKKKQEIILTPEQQREIDYQKAVRRMRGAEKMLQPADRIHMYKDAIQMFEALKGYENSKIYARRCRKRLPAARQAYRKEIYRIGMEQKKNAKSSSDYEEAIVQLQKIKHGSQAIADQITECKELKAKAQKIEKLKNGGLKLAALALLAAVIGIIWYLGTPSAHYLEGRFLMAIKDYDHASMMFARSAGYQDADRRLLECNYQRALLRAKEGEFERAVRILGDKVGDYKDAQKQKAAYEGRILKEAEIGDTVTYGSLQWIVADQDGDRRLLIRKAPDLADRGYHTSDRPVTWETSDLRKWLNGAFYEECFSLEEQAAIACTQIETEPNRTYGTDGGSATSDSVFLLDEVQAERYRELMELPKNRQGWWLRTPGKNADSAAFVAASGTVMSYGYAVSSKSIAIRPAIWVTVP